MGSDPRSTTLRREHARHSQLVAPYGWLFQRFVDLFDERFELGEFNA